MQTFKHLSLSDIDRIIEAGRIEIIDVEEDVLIDNLIGSTPAGDLILFEVCFLNSNASDYTVHISEGSDDAAALWAKWDGITQWREAI